ncbi:MAG: chromosomal replication initiator protein DnaA [Ruminococcaceae bacterium]|nr:chromosomal replication initiator protein DnaA [Oscillospiraceae bacterium]
MDSVYDLWRQITPSLHEEIGDTAYNVWIKDMQPVEMTAKDFVIKVPSTMHREVIAGRFVAEYIRPKLSSLLGIDMDVRLVLEDEMEKINNPSLDLSDQNFEYTFDNFIVGSANRFAHAAAQAVAQNPGGSYNPLFIYGPSGLGKTHLLFAIRDHILRQDPGKNIVYIKGDQFTNELIEAVSKSSMVEFRNKYRYADVFLMDDVQFIGGKVSTQEEFFHTFENLYQDHKQIVLTSDRLPKEINTLEERLRSRFENGLLADIQPPEFETRVAIIKRKAAFFNLDIPDTTCEFIANKIKNNVRQLEGVVKKMNVMCMMDKEKPTIATATAVIREIENDVEALPVTIERIVDEVCRALEVTPEDVYSRRHAAPISLARQACMYCIRETTNLSYDEIGSNFGGRDHTTVIYAVQRIQSLIDQKPDFRALIQDIVNNVRS